MRNQMHPMTQKPGYNKVIRKDLMQNDSFDENAELDWLSSQQLQKANLWIDDTVSLSVDEIVDRTRQFHKNLPVDLVVIDCLQLIRSERGNGKQHMTDVMNQLKALAVELNCPVLTASRLGRRTKYGIDPVPEIGDFADVNIPRIADEVLLLMNERSFWNIGGKTISLYVAKHRFVRSGISYFLDCQNGNEWHLQEEKIKL